MMKKETMTVNANVPLVWLTEAFLKEVGKKKTKGKSMNHVNMTQMHLRERESRLFEKSF